MTRNPSSRFRPCLEALEDRSVPTVTTSFTPSGAVPGGGFLLVRGDDGDDILRIENHGDGHITVATSDSISDFFNVAVMDIDTNGGQDQVYFLQMGNQVRSLDVVANLGAGDDKFLAGLGEKPVQGSLTFEIHGLKGADAISVDARGVKIKRRATLKVLADGGADSDSFDMDYKGVKQGALIVNAFGEVDASPNSPGGDRLRLDATLLDGSSPARGGNLTFDGGPGDDSLEMTLHGPEGLRLSGLIDGGDGFDTASHFSNVKTTNCERDTVVNVGGSFTKVPVLGGGVAGGRFQL